MFHPRCIVSRTLAVSLLLTAACAAIPGAAEAQAGPATRYLRERNDEVNELLRSPASPERDASVTRILSDLLDYEELARRSLAAHWDTRTPAQRTEFVDLLRQLVEQQYQNNLERVLDYEIRYVSEEEIDGGRTVGMVARSRAERRQPPVEITYSLHRSGSAWRVFDVTTDGSSMVQNYQEQFNRYISTEGWDGLIGRMRGRLTRSASGG